MALSINPIARYAQDGTWVDDWGGYDGTAIGATFDTVNQKLGNAAGSYDGLDDYLQIDNLAAALATTTKGSWAGWVRPVDATPLTVGRSIISFANASSLVFLYMFIQTDGTLRASAYEGGTQWVVRTDNPVFSDNTWAHVGLVHDGISPLLYVNGTAVAQTITNTTDVTYWFNDFANLDTGSLATLNDGTGPRNFFEGLEDETLFFDDALTAADFTYLWNGGAGREIPKSGIVFPSIITPQPILTPLARPGSIPGGDLNNTWITD